MAAARLIRFDGSTPVDANPCVLVIGNFDGVHLGHRAVLAQALAVAKRNQALPVCALTFDPHPSAIVGSGPQPLLTSLDDRVELMGAIGVQAVYVRQFDSPFASWPPARFVTELVVDLLHARVVVVGEGFRFGAKRSGDLALLRQMGREHGFMVYVPEIARDARGAYSSTRARDAIAVADLDEAQNVLGRPHAVTGTVVHGAGLGRALGFPTANMANVPQLLPPDGVYAVRVDRRDETGEGYEAIGPGAANLGLRPTVGGSPRLLEVHLLDQSCDLYGAKLRVHFIAKIRDETKFASLDDLRAQIAKDIDAARALLDRERKRQGAR